jgi:hypothetical protein
MAFQAQIVQENFPLFMKTGSSLLMNNFLKYKIRHLLSNNQYQHLQTDMSKKMMQFSLSLRVTSLLLLNETLVVADTLQVDWPVRSTRQGHI